MNTSPGSFPRRRRPNGPILDFTDILGEVLSLGKSHEIADFWETRLSLLAKERPEQFERFKSMAADLKPLHLAIVSSFLWSAPMRLVLLQTSRGPVWVNPDYIVCIEQQDFASSSPTIVRLAHFEPLVVAGRAEDLVEQLLSPDLDDVPRPAAHDLAPDDSRLWTQADIQAERQPPTN